MTISMNSGCLRNCKLDPLGDDVGVGEEVGVGLCDGDIVGDAVAFALGRGVGVVDGVSDRDEADGVGVASGFCVF